MLPLIDEEEEWMYSMRRSMQEVIPGLFLGPYGAACRSRLQDMKNAGLTHVVCVRASVEGHIIRPQHPDHFHYMVLDMDDSNLEMIIPKVKAVTEYIDECLNSNGKVLVHGNAGMCRSAALVVGYIMSKFGVTFKKANKYVQSKRFCICIKDAFAYQLTEYEAIYMAMHGTPTPPHVPGLTAPQFHSLKRTIDEFDENEEEPSRAPKRDRTGRDHNENENDMDSN